MSKIKKINKKTNEIEERLGNLEARHQLVIGALMSIIKGTKLDRNSSFAIDALISGFTKTELEEIEMTFMWAADKLSSHELTYEALEKRFKERLPRQQDSLRLIAKGYKVEGRFPYLCKFILRNKK